MMRDEDWYATYSPLLAAQGQWERNWRTQYANRIDKGNYSHLPGESVLERVARKFNQPAYPEWMGLPIAISPLCPKGQTLIWQGEKPMVVFHDTYDLMVARFWISLTPKLVLADMEAQESWRMEKLRSEYRLFRETLDLTAEWTIGTTTPEKP